MNNKIIAYANVSGGVSIVVPNLESGGLTLEQIMAKDAPVGAVIIDRDDVPHDYLFRDAFKISKDKIIIDASKAKAVFISKIREIRSKKFDDLDKLYIIAERDKTDLTALAADRQTLKDLTKTVEAKLTSAKTAEQIKACWPTEILGAL